MILHKKNPNKTLGAWSFFKNWSFWLAHLPKTPYNTVLLSPTGSFLLHKASRLLLGRKASSPQVIEVIQYWCPKSGWDVPVTCSFPSPSGYSHQSAGWTLQAQLRRTGSSASNFHSVFSSLQLLCNSTYLQKLKGKKILLVPLVLLSNTITREQYQAISHSQKQCYF